MANTTTANKASDGYKPILTATWAKPLSRADLGVIARYLATDGANVTLIVDDLEDFPRRSEALQALVERADNEHGSLVEQMLVTLDAAYATIHELRRARKARRKDTPKKATSTRMVTLHIVTTDKTLPNGLLSIVSQANAIEQGFFGTPTFVDGLASQIEDYPDARIVHRYDHSAAHPNGLDPRVTFKAKTERGNRVLTAVATHFGIEIDDT